MMSPLPRWRLRKAVRHLKTGGLIAYPTEGVWGLGCDPWNLEAVERILTLKQRPVEKGLILIASDFGQLMPFILPPPKERFPQILRSWPGAVTWILPASPTCPAWIRGSHATVATRVTAHPVAAALCRAFGAPLVSTSANPAQSPPALSALSLRRYFGRRADLLLVPGPVGNLRGPTPIFDALSGRCLRREGE